MSTTAARVYRAVLHLVPAGLREAFGDEMVALFVEELELARSRGRLAMVATIARAFADIASRATYEHWRRRDRRVTREARMQSFLSDIRYATRALVRAPSFTIAAVLALGLGIGCAAGVFGLFDGVVLRPLPYANPERLVTVWETNQEKSLLHEGISPVNFGDYRQLRHVFQDAAAWWRPQLNLTDDATGDAIRVTAIEVSTNLFSVLGVQPAIGRDFAGDSLLRTSAPEVVISHRLWQSRFGGTPSIVGKAVRLNNRLHTIIGVMPRGFGFPGETDVWQGLSWTLSQHSRGAHFMETVARLKQGMTIDRANAELTTLGARLGDEHRDTNAAWRARVISLDREIAGPFRPALFLLVAASALLLLIACINVANLLLARATARRREVAVRAAIGANRSRLARLFLAEALVLTVFGSLLGLVIAVASVKGLLAWSPIVIPRADTVGMSGRVLLYSIAIATFTTLTFGLLPAYFSSRADLQRSLKEGDKGSGRQGKKTRGALVMAEVALAVMLLSGAGLLIRSVTSLLHESTGVDPSGVIATDIQLSGAAYKDWTRVDQFYTSLRQQLLTHPEITSTGVTSTLPLEVGWRIAFSLPGSAPVPATDAPTAQIHTVDVGYLETVHAPVVRGRTFDAHDDVSSVSVVVVNETFARQQWPGQNPIGQRIHMEVSAIGPLGRRLSSGNDHEVIGVARDIKNSSLRVAAEPAVYFSARQFPFLRMNVVMRGTATPTRLAELLRIEVRRLDPTLPVPEFRTMDRVLATSVDPPRFVMFLMSAFAVLALTLAAVGIYGVLTYTVNQQQREIGIRVALGAHPGAMLRMIVQQGLGLTLGGCALGMTGAWLAGRSLSGFLYGVSAFDPLTVGVVVLVVTVVALGACLVPGRRAAGQDPCLALRTD